MTRRPSRATARRSALAVSIMLIGSTLALPALATDDGPENGIISPQVGDVFSIGEQLHLKAFEADATSVQWAVRLVDPDPNSSGTVAGNVDSKNDPSSLDDGLFTATVSTAGWQASDEYFFVFNPSPGARYVVQFEIVDAFGDFEPDEVVTCEEDEEECSTTTAGGTGQSFTASTDARGKNGESAFLGLRIATDSGAVADAVEAACAEAAGEVNPSARLGPEVFQLVPVNFEEGSITVQSTIPRKIVNLSTARGAGIFQVCIAAEADEYGGYSGLSPILDTDNNETGLFGPVILDDCDEESTVDHACVLNKTKERGAVVLTYQLPTEDPWGMS